MRFPKLHQFLTLLLVMTAMVSCNDERKQYGSNAPKSKDKSERAIIDNNIPAFTEQEQAESKTVAKEEFKTDAQQIENSSVKSDSLAFDPNFEIIPGVGVAGVTFESIPSDSMQKLGKPLEVKKVGGNVITYFPNSIAIAWSNTNPQVPIQFTMLSANVTGPKAYQGGLNLGETYGMIGLDTNLYDIFQTSNLMSIAVKIGQSLDKKGDDYNCLAEKKCKILASKVQDILDFGLVKLYVSRNTKLISLIQTQSPLLHTKLKAYFDLISGIVFTKPDQGFGLGEKWGEVSKQILQSGKIASDASSFNINYGEITLRSSKSNFSEDYKEPSADERVNGYLLTAKYNDPIVFNGELLNPETMTFSKNKIESPFSMKTQFTAENYKEKLKGLEKAIQSKFKAINPESVILSKIRFLESNTKRLNAVLEITVWSEGDQKGHNISIIYSKITNKFVNIVVTDVDNIELFKKIKLGVKDITSLKDVGALPSLAGFKIGDVVQINGFNFATGEAELVVPEQDTAAAITQRIIFDVTSSRTGMYLDGNGVMETNEVVTAIMSEYGVNLDLAVADISKATYKVIGISSSNQIGGFDDLCNDENLSFSLTDKLELIKWKVTSHKISEKYDPYGCPIYLIKDELGNGIVKSIAFPKHQLMFNFLDNYIENTVIYSRAWEVK